MRRFALLLAAVALAGCGARAASAPVATKRPAPAAAARGDATVRPGVGIGPVRLGDTRAALERRLGRGRSSANGISVVFDTPRGRLLAEFDAVPARAASRVVSVQTADSSFRVRGIGTRSSYREARAALIGWEARSCDQVAYVYRNATPTGPGTAWGRDRLTGKRMIVRAKPWREPCSYLAERAREQAVRP